jgi:hypothetical protein
VTTGSVQHAWSAQGPTQIQQEKQISDFIVHYNRNNPFRSITSAADPAHALKMLNEENTWGSARFHDPQYLAQRYQTEERLRKRFVELGGRPKLTNPIYFFLGRNAQFEQNEKNIGYAIDLRDINPLSISFTYGDSMISSNHQYHHLVAETYRHPLCHDLYGIFDLPRLFAAIQSLKVETLHIEAQLWKSPDFQLVRILR